MTFARFILPAAFLLAATIAPAQEKQKAMMRVHLPVAGAKLEIQGTAIKVTDKDVRLFESPPLESGKPYVYDLKVTWTENGKEMTRERSVKVVAGQTTEVDLRLVVDTSPHVVPSPTKTGGEKPADKPGDKPADKPAGDDKSFIAPSPTVVEAMLQLAKVGPTDIVADLGSGDGRIAIAAVDAGKARKAIGFESNPTRVATAKRNAAAIADKAEFREKDFTTVTAEDLALTSVVTIGTATMQQLKQLVPVFKKLKPGARIVVHEVEIPDMKFDEKRELKVDQLDHVIYLYVIK